MNRLFKANMEILILNQLDKRNQYGYELIENLNGIFDVSGNSVYPILHRFHKDGYVESYLEESPSGAPRKYYKLTPDGHSYYSSLVKNFVRLIDELGLRKEEK